MLVGIVDLVEYVQDWYAGTAADCAGAEHFWSFTVRPHEQQHSGSGALPAVAGVLIVHVRVAVALVQP